MKRPTRTTFRRLGLLGVAVLVLAGLFAGGYAIGAAGGEDLAAGREQGRESGAKRGISAGERAGYAAGVRGGRKLGYRAAYRPAYKRGYRAGIKKVEALGPAPASAQPTSCSEGLVSAANGCVPESDASCAAYQDFVPGQGCVPPLAPSAVEAAPQCPPGQIPVGITGACAPP
jgi:hypothetical protein